MKRQDSVGAHVAIIMPAYNEGSVIYDNLRAIPDIFQKIVVVDDGSSDNTAQQIARTSADLIVHPINLGQGAALQTGISYALLDPDIDYFVTFDADGQHRIEDVKLMLGHIRAKKLDVVLGSRFLGKTENMTFLKRRILKLAVVFTSKTSGIKLTDAHNGLRVFNRHAASQLNITMSDFSHASEIIERIADKKFSYEEYPVTIRYTDYSRKKGQSVFNAINIGFDILLNKVTRR